MGYYTRYSLSLPNKENISEVVQDFKTYATENDWCIDGFEDDGSAYGEYKWYNHEDNMKKYSRLERNKNILFCLHGEGEDGEYWRKYFLNGKMQICMGKIIFEDFNPKKLRR